MRKGQLSPQAWFLLSTGIVLAALVTGLCLLGAFVYYLPVIFPPPSISPQFTGAFTFLLNDCSSKGVDNLEGLRRLVQIVQNMEDASSLVQTSQGATPVPELRGNVNLLRIGSVYEAAADDKSGACAVWRGIDSAYQPVWKLYTDRATVTAIREAINIREGKTLPAFTTLPFGKASRKEMKQ